VERVRLVGVLSRVVVFEALLLALVASLSLMVRKFVTGMIHSDVAIRESEGGSSNYSRGS